MVRIVPATFADVKPFASRAAKERSSVSDTPRTQWYLIFDNDFACGCVGMMTVSPGRTRIKGVYVEPAHRGMGISTYVLDKLLADYLALGVVEAYVWKPKWYLARGFRVIGRNAHGAELVRRDV